MVPFLIYFCLAVSGYGFFYSRTKDVLNPFSIVLLSFLGVFALGRLQLNAWQIPISPITYAIVTVVALEIFVIGLVFVKPFAVKDDSRSSMPCSTRFSIAYRFLLALCLIGIFVEFAQSGFRLDALSSIDAFDKKSALDVEVGDNGIVSYLTLLLPYMALFACYELLFKEKRDAKCLLFNGAVVVFSIYYTWFVQLSRGTLIIILLGAIYLYHQKRKLKMWQGVLVLVLFVTALSFMLTFRLDMQSAVYRGLTANPLLNSLYNYLALGFSNFDTLVTSNDQLTWFNSVWAPILKLFGAYDPSIVNDYSLHFFNTKTMLYYEFHDLGVLGVVLYPGIIFSILAWLYNNSKTTKPYLSLLLAAMQKAIFMTHFGDYFIGSFGVIFPYLAICVALWYAYGSGSTKKEKCTDGESKRIQRAI